MPISEKEILIQEYVTKLKVLMIFPLKLFGIGRIDISPNNQIVQKDLISVFLSIFILAIINFCCFYIIYVLAIRTSYLLITEVIILVDFLIFHNCVLINMSFANRRNAAQFINNSVDIDLFLGSDETLFMRDLSLKIYFTLCTNVGICQVVILMSLLFTYMIDLYVLFAGTFLFILLYSIYYDLSFFLWLYTFLTLRVRYLNVALMRLANINLEYLPDQFPFNYLFWTKNLDDLVDFHKRATIEDFSQAFKMMFNQMRYMEGCYRFTIFCCLTYLIVGTFVTVQSYIICLNSTNVDTIRIGAITGWCVLSWFFQIVLSYQTDMLQRQLHQTSLICTFIQLKSTYPDEIYKMTANIISVLTNRDPRMSIFGLFYFDTGLLLRIASAVFVYITMQLQIAFPKTYDVVTVDNATIKTL